MEVTVKPIQNGYGLTDGKKWFFYFYPTAAMATEVLVKCDHFRDPVAKRVNISHDTPLKLVQE